MLLSEGLDAVGLSIYGPAGPTATVHVPLAGHGLHVLYGRNGAGKTTVLDALVRALRGDDGDGEAVLHVELRSLTLGWDPAMLTALKRLTRVTVDGAEATPGGMLASLADDDDGDFYVDGTPEAEDRFKQGVDALRHDLFLLTQRHANIRDWVGGPNELQLSLSARRSGGHPGWDVYVSAVPVPGTPLHDTMDGWAVAHPRTPVLPPDFADEVLSKAPSLAWLVDAERHALSSAGRAPAYVPLRLLRIGHLQRRDGFVATIAPSDDAADVAARCLEVLGAEQAVGYGEGGRIDLDDDFLAAIERLSKDASAVVTGLLGEPTELRLALTDPAHWLRLPLVAWTCRDAATGTFVPIERLSAAQRRWAAIGIDVAASRHALDLPVILVLDEPERSLHPGAVDHLATSITNVVGEGYVGPTDGLVTVVVATHAPAMLNAAQASLHHVARNDAGEIEVRRLEMGPVDDVTGLAEDLGCTRADLLNLVRRWIFVEGTHDQIVVQTCFRDEVVANRWQILPLRGARNTAAAVNSRFIVDYSTADIVVVLDHLDQPALDLWNQGCDAYRAGDLARAARRFDDLTNQPGSEARFLGEAGREALTRGGLPRINVVGLAKADILEYLDPHELGLHASWAELDSEYRAANRGTRRSGDDYKRWLREQHHAKINPTTIRRAAERLDDYGDLARILHI